MCIMYSCNCMHTRLAAAVAAAVVAAVVAAAAVCVFFSVRKILRRRRTHVATVALSPYLSLILPIFRVTFVFPPGWSM